MPLVMSEALPGKGFERRVAAAYRELGYRVIPNTRVAGKQTDLLAQRFISGAPSISLAIECKDQSRPVGNEQAMAFVNRIVTHRAANRIIGGVLVSASGFTADARQAVDDHPYISLLSWEELVADLVDIRSELKAIVRDYEASVAERHYLPLSTETLSWSTLRPTDGPSVPLNDLLDRWKDNPDSDRGAPNSIFVLGDFGAGKTTLLRNLEYELAKAYLALDDTRAPLFVALRHFRDSQDVGTLLRASFRDAYQRDMPGDLIWQQLQDGRFYVLLDGFDEMAERSDPDRRLELFHKLLPVLRSRSRTIVTSRPGYFVGRGELEGLLEELHAHEAQVTEVTSPVEGGSGLPAGLLRRKLIARHREVPMANVGIGMSLAGTATFKLLPLSTQRIGEFLDRHAPELEGAGSSPTSLMDFISRTYDLTDLASRPLLLTLIVDSVVVGGLNPDDTENQYGASGLYEIYTDTRLHLDLVKGRIRQAGLGVHARRLLAEALAIHMYEEDVLEVDFHKLLGEMPLENEQLRGELAKHDLTIDEIATDFATCSFVTLEEGVCRFVHKSFRGFFLARVLKDALGRDQDHPLFDDWLERETLYFLGGFAPTLPAVGEQLWQRFLHAPRTAHSLRRNMLVAFLHTHPTHESRPISDADLADAEFGRLGFRRSRMSAVRWIDVAVKQLELTETSWAGVQLVGTHVAALEAKDSKLDFETDDSSLEAIRFVRADAQIAAKDSTIGSCRLSEADVRLAAEATQFATLEVARGSLVCNSAKRVALESVEIEEGRLRIEGKWEISKLRTRRAAISLQRDRLEDAPWSFRESVVSISLEQPEARRSREGRGPPAMSIDSHSVILPLGKAAEAVLQVGPCGVFGAFRPSTLRTDILTLTRAWGVLDAGDGLSRFGADADAARGVRFGNLLLVDHGWYARAVFPGGELASVDRLQRFATESHSGEDFSSWELLPELLAAVRGEFDEVMTMKNWPVAVERDAGD